MLDIKCMDEEESVRITGLSNDIVLKNLKYLLDKDKLHEVRTVIAPNLNNEYTVTFTKSSFSLRSKVPFVSTKQVRLSSFFTLVNNSTKKSALRVHSPPLTVIP